MAQHKPVQPTLVSAWVGKAGAMAGTWSSGLILGYAPHLWEGVVLEMRTSCVMLPAILCSANYDSASGIGDKRYLLLSFSSFPQLVGPLLHVLNLNMWTF